MRRWRGHSAAYRAHLRSPKWHAIRKAALKRAGNRCQDCGRSHAELRRRGRWLEVHHKHYRNLGHERPEDLAVLCSGRRGCHARADRQRHQHTRRSRRRSLGLLRVPVLFVLAAGGLKVASIVLPALQ